MRWIGLVLLTVALTGCFLYDKPDSGETGDRIVTSPDTSYSPAVPTYSPQFTVTVTWTDDGADPLDTDGDQVPDVQCGDALDITIVDPLMVQDWDFGMAETGPNGWTGEDCFNGFGASLHCHPIGLVHSLEEVTSCDLADIVPGSTTLFDASKDPYLTYYLDDLQGFCFVFGADPAYYAALGCTEMM